MTETLYGIIAASALFMASFFLVLNAAGKGAARLMGTVSAAFVMKLFLIFALLAAVKFIYEDIPRNFVISLLVTYLVLLGVQLVIVLKKLKRIYSEEKT